MGKGESKDLKLQYEKKNHKPDDGVTLLQFCVYVHACFFFFFFKAEHGLCGSVRTESGLSFDG